MQSLKKGINALNATMKGESYPTESAVNVTKRSGSRGIKKRDFTEQ